jgi:hypothetical protein
MATTSLRGKVSWFGGPNDHSTGPTTASGSPIARGGIAIYNYRTLGGWWRVRFPNGRVGIFQQTDIGPAPYTGRVLDVAYSSLKTAGYTEANFPTNSEVTAQYLGKDPALKSGSPSFLEVLNPFNAGTIGRNASEIARKAGGVMSFVTSSKQQEKAGEELGQKAKKAATGWVGELLEGAGKLVLTGILLLAGMFLVVYGIMAAVRPRERALALPGR